MTWMQLESIMLSEISQRKTKTIWFHSYVDFKKQNKWAKGKKRERERERQTKKWTLNYREQTDGYQRGCGWRNGWNRWWRLRNAFVMSTRCCMEGLNHYTAHLKLISHCMLTNWNLSRLHTQHGVQPGAGTQDPEIKTWAKIKSWMPNRLSHPGAPT